MSMSIKTDPSDIKLPASTLTKCQVKTFRKDYINERGEPCVIVAEVRHDDECGNGHNTFAITAEIYEKHMQRGEPTVKHESGKTLWLASCGCQHDEVAKHFPDLAPLLNWHLTSTDGPMHYLANTVYHASNVDFTGKRSKPRALDYARNSAVWPEATDEQLCSDPAELQRMLAERLPALMEAFKRDVESLGFTY